MFVDWSQNDRHKTTICAYSLRIAERPTVSTPITWDEVHDALEHGDPDALAFEAPDVLERVAAGVDHYARSLTVHQELPLPLDIPAMDLDGKVAIVTGASRGVGAATAMMLAERGCKVVCAARATDATPVPIPGTIDETVRKITDAGGDRDCGADQPRQGRRGRAHDRGHRRALRPGRHARQQRRDHVPRRPRPRHEALRPPHAGRPAGAAARDPRRDGRR